MPEEGYRDSIGDERVVEAIGYPGPEGRHLEECAFLAELVQLRVAVKEAGGDELVENADGERRGNREEDIVEGERPRLEDDLARIIVEKRVLRTISTALAFKGSVDLPKIASCTGQYSYRRSTE